MMHRALSAPTGAPAHRARLRRRAGWQPVPRDHRRGRSPRAVDAAWDAGIRYFDTAPHYGLGLSERRLGAALRTRPRDEYVVSTKVGRLLVPSPQDGAPARPGGVRRRRRPTAGSGTSAATACSARSRPAWSAPASTGSTSSTCTTRTTTGSRPRTEAVPALVELRDQGVIGADRGGHEPVGDARPVRPGDRRRRGDVRRPVHPARTGRAARPAARRAAPRRRRRDRRGLQLRPARQRPATGRRDLQLPAGARRAHRPRDPHRRGLRGARRTLPEAALAFVRSHPAVVSTVVGLRSARRSPRPWPARTPPCRRRSGRRCGPPVCSPRSRHDSTAGRDFPPPPTTIGVPPVSVPTSPTGRRQVLAGPAATAV